MDAGAIGPSEGEAATPTLKDHAIRYQGMVESNGAIRVPAEWLPGFLSTALSTGIRVGFIDCVFISGRTRASVQLSAKADEFADQEAFVAFAKDASARAIAEANMDGSEPFFEVGP